MGEKTPYKRIVELCVFRLSLFILQEYACFNQKLSVFKIHLSSWNDKKEGILANGLVS